MRIAQRAQIQIRLLILVLASAFLSASGWGQTKPVPGQTASQQPPVQKSLPLGPPSPQSTHYPILLLGFGNQPNWTVRIGLKGPERFDREGYPPIPLEPAEVTHEATGQAWTYHAKDSATGAVVAVHLSRETCTDATNDTLGIAPPLGGKYSFKISIDHAQIGSLKGCGRIATELFPKINNRPDQDDDDTKKKPPAPVSSVTKFQSPIVVAYVNATQQLAFKRGSIVRSIPGASGSDLSPSHDGKKLLFTRQEGAVRAINEYDYDSNSVKELLRGDVRNPVWSPDDSRVAHLNHQGGKWQLWAFPANDPTKAAVISADAFESIQGWSDPRTLLVLSANPALAWIGEDGKPTQTLSISDLCGADFVPGTRLAVRLHPTNPDLVLVSALFARPPAGVPPVENGQAGALFFYEFRSKRRAVLTIPNLSATDGEWSRDGFQILFTGTDSSRRKASYRVFWDAIGLQKYVTGTSLVVGL
ncbi:MAG TPA: hypothetical protein VJN89_16820 [Candidatus Acidoferrum sp.]|nr:hypothetical protein [Candidatus Acidoferrum sp.]